VKYKNKNGRLESPNFELVPKIRVNTSWASGDDAADTQAINSGTLEYLRNLCTGLELSLQHTSIPKMVWGAPGSTESLKGASGRYWDLTFERRLAPRPGHAENPASSVWKRQNVSSGEVESLVDEAAVWRKSSLDCPVLAELVDVFVNRDPPSSVTFLHEFCARGHIPKRAPSEPVLLTIIADLAEASDAVSRATRSAHGNISYETVLVDDDGHAKLIGFGAKRSAKLAHNPEIPTEHDVADIGAFICHLVLGRPLKDNSAPPDLPYNAPIVSFVESLLEAPESGLRSHEAS